MARKDRGDDQPLRQGSLFDYVEGGLPLLTADEIYEQANEELLQRISEDPRVERKPAAIHTENLGDYFAMWANTVPDGGVIVVGMENDGAFSGCSGLTADQLNKLERTGDVFCPDARYQSKKVEVRLPDGKRDFVLLIRIAYRTDRLVRTVKGEAFARRGESKRRLTLEEARELEIDKGQIQLELEPCGLAFPQEFDQDMVRQFVNSVKATRELDDALTDQEVLELRHLGRTTQDKFTPNVACALLFAKDPARIIPGCKIRFLRFDGEQEGAGEKFNAIKDIFIEGQVPKLVTEVERVIDSQLREFNRLGSDGKFYTAPEYPKIAWYEAVVNACVHRSYGLKNMNIFIKMFDDRLVIESPGPFPPFVTPDNIYDMHHPRNPHLMDAMFYLKFVKCAHEGTRRMRDTMKAVNLPAPEFGQKEKETSYAVVRVTLRNDIKQRKVWVDSVAGKLIGEAMFKSLGDDERRVINFVAENRTINVSQVQRLTGRSWGSAKTLLNGLEKKRRVLECIRRGGMDRDPQAHYVLRTPNDK